MDDRKILDFQPLPIARGYRRCRNAREARERHDVAYSLFEIYLKYLASIAIARYLSVEQRDHRVNAVLKGLARPSLGEWLRFLRECLQFLTKGEGADASLQALASLVHSRDSRWPGVVELFNGLRSFRAEKASEKRSVDLEMLLGEIVAYRNRVIGHGAHLSADHYEKFAELFAKGFAEVLQESPLLTVLRLVSFDAIRVERGNRVECDVVEFMGQTPVRREKPLVLEYGKRAPEKDCLYLLGDDGDLLLLDPLLVTHQEDVYFLNEADGAREYLSYSSGERYRPTQLESAQGELFERILGYKVDAIRLSEIGDDLARTDEAIGEAQKEEERRLGDFRILREIGRGGMGTVHEAVQESLGRRVAIKVLAGSFSLDPKRLERFRREARATARIHHRNIVPVYEVGEADGSYYYAMEYIDGPSLDQVIAQARETGEEKRGTGSSSAADGAHIENTVEQVAELADGLEEAHRQGIIHRDVKPSNILVDRDGRHVLVDFGLVHDVEAQTITRSGEMVGTLHYMSPEQVSRRRVDPRSDVYSLGVTLYEALTLRAPHGGESDHEIQNAILFTEPAPPRKFNSRIGRDLETILLKALEKNPERRYQTAAEFAADLRRFLRREPIQARPPSAVRKLGRGVWKHRVRVGALLSLVVLALAIGLAWKYIQLVSAIQSLAVLPFTFEGAQPDETYLCEGLTEGLINDLSQIPDLRVLAPSLVFSEKRKGMDPRELGSDLKVRAVVSGRIDRQNGNLMLQARMVDTRDGAQLWGDRFALDPEDFLSLQKEMAKKISEALKPRLSIEERRGLARRSTRNPRAHSLYRKGRSYLTRGDPENVKNAIACFEEAIKQDEDYALAYSGLADSYTILRMSGLLPPEESYRKGKGFASKAFRLDDQLAETHTSLAIVLMFYEWKWNEALDHVQRAIELNRNYMLAHQLHAAYLMRWGRLDEAIDVMTRVVELDPFTLNPSANAGYFYYVARRYDKAMEILRETLDLNPDFPASLCHLGLVYVEKGMYAEAVETFRKGGDSPIYLGLDGYAHAAAGEREQAEEVIRELDRKSKTGYVSPMSKAWIYMGLGEKDRAFECIEKAIEVRDWVVTLLGIEPSADCLRGDPRFEEVLKRIGLPNPFPGGLKV